MLRLQYFPLTNGQDTWNGILNIDCRDIQANHLKIASTQQSYLVKYLVGKLGNCSIQSLPIHKLYPDV